MRSSCICAVSLDYALPLKLDGLSSRDDGSLVHFVGVCGLLQDGYNSSPRVPNAQVKCRSSLLHIDNWRRQEDTPSPTLSCMVPPSRERSPYATAQGVPTSPAPV